MLFDDFLPDNGVPAIERLHHPISFLDSFLNSLSLNESFARQFIDI